MSTPAEMAIGSQLMFARSQGIMFGEEGLHRRILRKAHCCENRLETAQSDLQERGDLGRAGELVWRDAQLSKRLGLSLCAREANFWGAVKGDIIQISTFCRAYPFFASC
jgi:hypothetical protein